MDSRKYFTNINEEYYVCDEVARSRIIHMKDYVVPNGNTDNTELMQKAINEAAGKILIIDGNVLPYRCNQLLLKSNSLTKLLSAPLANLTSAAIYDLSGTLKDLPKLFVSIFITISP